ncbi:MAG: GntR family transcriptional regulator [Bacteroidetes bacterium]|nr:GntR family transcriptional regulator [Bacteroidota bacterium]
MNTFSGKTITISNQVADYLRDEIISGNIKSGERIKESGLTQKFNVSSISVREALKKIESEIY